MKGINCKLKAENAFCDEIDRFLKRYIILTKAGIKPSFNVVTQMRI